MPMHFGIGTLGRAVTRGRKREFRPFAFIVYNLEMQAVILAAGKGTRMEHLTKELPKPLLRYGGKSLLQHKIEDLPDTINEIVIVIGYLGENIKSELGDSYNNKKICYVEDKEINGTAMALWQAKDLLKENFLVIMGDDIYSKESFLNASKETWSITVKKIPREDPASRIELDKDGKLIGFLVADKYRAKYDDGGYAFTGLYSLNKKIFNYPMVKMDMKDEWGLPHTLLKAVPDIDLKILETEHWRQITSPKDLQ